MMKILWEDVNVCCATTDVTVTQTAQPSCSRFIDNLCASAIKYQVISFLFRLVLLVNNFSFIIRKFVLVRVHYAYLVICLVIFILPFYQPLLL